MNIFPTPLKVDEPSFKLRQHSTILALIAGLIAGVGFFRDVTVLKDPDLQPVLYILDPILLQLIAIAHLSVCLFLWAWSEQERRSTSSRRFWSAVVPIVTMATVLVIYYILNNYVFKVSFERPRPPEAERLIVGFLCERFGVATTGGAPSGFAGRGVLILLAAVLTGHAIKLQKVSHRFPLNFIVNRWTVIIFQSLLLVLTCFARVATGQHYLFDVLLGLCLGTYTFWLLLMLICVVNRAMNPTLVPRPLECETDRTGPFLLSLLIGFSLIGFFYCRDTTHWAPTVLGAIAIVVLIQVLSSKMERDSKCETGGSNG